MSEAKAEQATLAWRKARRSMGAGDCVEVSPADGEVLVRDSKNPGGARLGYPAGAWQSFLSGARQGNFDVSKMLFSRYHLRWGRSCWSRTVIEVPGERGPGAYAPMRYTFAR